MRTPSFEPRRRKEIEAELVSRARLWLADWQPADDGDFATALFKIAARLESEVTQRLDRVPVKAFYAFLDWLGVKGKPGRAARLPVVFTMIPGSTAIDAPERVQLQINTGDTPTKFETERALRILPGALTSIVAVDPASDAFYLPPPGVFTLDAPKPLPSVWHLVSDAPVGSATMQLDPPSGLDVGLTLVDPAGQEYRITAVQGAIVTIEPPVGTIESKAGATPPAGAPIVAGTSMARLDLFTPFSATERNRQQHELLIGADGALNIDAPAWIALEGGATLSSDVQWYYSGKKTSSSPVGWLPFGTPTDQGGDRLLYKPAGTIEKLKVDGYESRWLRMTHAAGLTGRPQTTPPLRLLINCDLPKDQQPAVTAIEGIANTAPLVLTAGFYPFGREPRQFDSFYLGSKEALSKPSAEVTLHFALGDVVNSAHAALALGDTDYLTFGVSEDGRLQRMGHQVVGVAPSLTPTLAFQSATQPVSVDLRPITLTANLRPGAAIVAGVANVSAGAGSEVWLWRGTAAEEWKLLDKPSTTSEQVTATLLAVTGITLAVYAIAGGKLYRRLADDGAAWSLEDVGATSPVAIVAPVVGIDSRAGEQAEDSGIVAVTSDGLMYLRTAGTWSKVSAAANLDPTFYPLVVVDGGGNLSCVTRNKTKKPLAFELAPGATVRTAAVELIGHAVDFVSRGGTDVLAIISAIIGGTPVVAIWDGFHGAAPAPLADASGHQPSEAPVVVGLPGGGDRFVYVPGDDGTAFVVNTGLEQYLEQTPVTDAALFTDAHTTWATQTNLLIDIGGTVNRRVLAVNDVLQTVAPDQWLFKLEHASAPRAASSSVDVYEALETQPFDGTWKTATKLTLDAADGDAMPGLFLSVDVNGTLRVVKIASVAAGVATLSAGTPLPSASAGDPVPYRVCQPPTAPLPATLTVELRPAVDIPQLDPDVAAVLVKGTLESQDPALTPKSQKVRYVIAGKVAVLDAAWSATPANAGYDFFAVVGAFEKWMVFEPPAPHNPTLSWEYYDGTAWRPIPSLTDTTDALAQAGDVVFCVPKDLKPTDVVGRTSSWIRARLVGGDYGQETVTVTTSPGPTAGTTIQTVNRNTDSIKAPYVSALTVTYQVCCPVVPDFVLARDNGMLRDETAINRQRDALVDYFVPLGSALAGLAGGDASAATERALFLGVDTPLTGEAIQILFLVDEGSNDDAYPLRVDVLAGDRFTPITTLRDDTRGLNESGVLELDVAQPPRQTALFGGAGQFWLRVRPGTRMVDTSQWQPAIRGAYLNATWAVAADTQSIEPLGSSDGSPNQKFRLARPPVLEDSLSLRVFEPLGDEDVALLTQQGIDVKTSLPNVAQQGSWVLWKEVIDPADEAPTERVYSLDDATGIITFGDGLHGMIPPIGANVILAERYQTGGGEKANTIAAWAKVNLVTALQGVKSVIPPDGAAGGSDPQDPDTTVRFAPANLRVRDRALTRADLEVLTLQFSRDVAQARAIPAGTGTRVVAAMRGRVARPSAAALRGLRAYLLERALPSLAVEGALVVTGPTEIWVRVDLTLVIDTIESSADVAQAVRDRIAALIDVATGGHDQTGWALGAIPTDTDIAAALDGIEHLETLEASTVTRADGVPLRPLKPYELVRLAPDGVTVRLLLPETEATP
jgi:hypothetical protein